MDLNVITQMLAASGVGGVAESDLYFNYTTLLLHGDGTNGAQNNTFLDSSTNAFSITRNGNTTQGTFSPFSQTGWSNYFDGTSDYLNVASNTAFNISSGAYTLELFVYFNTVPSVNVLFGFSGTGTTGYPQLLLSSNVLYWQQRGTSANETSVSWAPSPGQWYHIAVGWNGSNSLAIWINGSRVVTNTVTPTSGGQNGLNIGGASDGYSINGYLSNARLVKGTDVYGVGNSTITVPTAALTAITNTSLLTCQSNRFVDNSTNAFTITRNGDVSVQAFSPFAPTAAYSAATNGGSGYFDGSGDYLSFTTNSSFVISGDFTVEFWAYFTATGTYQPLLDQYTAAGFLFRVSPGSSINGDFYINSTSGGDGIGSFSGTACPINAWNFFRLIRSGSTVTVYCNGVSVGSRTRTGNVFANSSAFGIANYSSNYFTGYLSGLRIVPTALTGTEIPTSPPTAISNTKFLANFTNAGITDATAKNDLETVGNAQIDTGTKKFGTGSLKFDGNGDYLQMRQSSIGEFQGAFTMECWVYLNALPNDEVGFFESIDWGGQLGQYCFGVSSANKLLFYMFDGANQYYASSATLTTSQWIHCAVSRDAAGNGKLFINGVNDGTFTNSYSLTNVQPNPYKVGASKIGGTLAYLNGFIDDLRITKGVARYTDNFTAPTKAFADQ